MTDVPEVLGRVTITSAVDYDQPRWMRRIVRDTELRAGLFGLSLQSVHVGREELIRGWTLVARSRQLEGHGGLQQSLHWQHNAQSALSGLVVFPGTLAVGWDGNWYMPYHVRMSTTDSRVCQGWTTVNQLYGRDYFVARDVAGALS